MVLCEIMNGSDFGFLETWAVLSGAAFLSLGVICGIPFRYYYMHPTYEKWLIKTNREYPSAAMVRSEAYKTLTGSVFVTLSPTVALYLAKRGWHSQAYCGVPHGWGYELAQFVLVFFLTDFFEWGWHYMGHRFGPLWEVHKPHHRYYNPSPWAVIADDWLDEIVRGSPLFLIPMLFPTNVDLLFLQFALFFNIYGTMIHTGVDWAFLPIHGQRVLNTPYHHHIHHALSIKNKPLHTGFFLQVWDRAMGSVYAGDKCFCSQCDFQAGNRTREKYAQVVKPDYSLLLDYRFWWEWKGE